MTYKSVIAIASASLLSACFNPEDSDLDGTESEAGTPTTGGDGMMTSTPPTTGTPQTGDDANPTSADADADADTDDDDDDDADADADTDDDADADADTDDDDTDGTTGSPVDPLCGDGIPVATEVCFDDPPITYTVEDGPAVVAVGDMTSNGLPDIVVLSQGSQGADEGLLTILEADGVGGFIEGDTMTGPDLGFQLRILDSDGDDDNDIFAAGGGELRHYRNQAAFFSNTVAATWFSGFWEIGELLIADVNADDIVDVVHTEAYAHSVVLGQLGGSGWQSSGDSTGFPSTGEGAAGMFGGPLTFDGDNDFDIVALNQYYSTVEVFTNNGGGVFSEHSTPALCPGQFEGVRHGEAADLDGDGNTDLVATCMTGDIGIALGDGTGTYPTYSTLPLAGSYRPYVADISGDGYPDIVVTSSALNRAVLFVGNGDGTFEVSDVDFLAPNPVYGAAIADLNDDGALDIIVVTDGLASGEVHVYYATP